MVGEEDGDSIWTDVASESEGLCDGEEERNGDALLDREEKDGLGEIGDE